jgi:6-phosphogluconolactonase/glucosamine-6-phosphate isomerase/deaminase
MDGHWGFHGSETPLDIEPTIIKVPMNDLNIQQQMIDWPQYFKSEKDVPSVAYTASVPLFMKADTIIDLVPQATKAFAVLACYGIVHPSQLVPSSVLTTHVDSHSYLTIESSWALVEYVKEKKLSDTLRTRLKALWENRENPQLEAHNQHMMESILDELF